jgi:phosphoheptose isomerase
VKSSIATELSQKIFECYFRGGKVLICGNGGLAAESEHFAGELMGKYGRDIYIPCIALTTNSTLTTAISNDMGFDVVFSHQVRVLGKPGDVFIGMTTSIAAKITAEIAGMDVIILNRENIKGKDVAEIQENILKLLHQVAREAKEIIWDMKH